MLAVDPVTRLADVTFCVLDLETTGTSDEVDEIIEVGAVLVRGGQRLGSLQTLVRHPLAVGPSDLPSIGSVLSSLLEFIRGAVIVGHNISFDLRFLNSALWKAGHDVVLHPAEAIDTVALARRLLRDDADDCRLGTLAQRFQFDHRPTHRALADAEATVELLHLVIERATHYGALDLDDLMRLPSLMRHRHRAKLAITATLPRSAGVACMLDRYGKVLHVVEAADLRHGVRSLFDTETGRGVPGTVLQHVHRIDIVQCQHPVVAQLVSLRWTAVADRSRRADAVYLQAGTARSRRLRITNDRHAAHVVAGPLPRAVARRVVLSLGAQPIERTDRFIEALAPSSAGGDFHAGDVDGVLIDVIEQQRAIAAVRCRREPIVVDGAVVLVDDGAAVDVTIGGRSWADRLPVVVAGDESSLPATPARAAEALYLARLISGPVELGAG